MKNDNDKVGLLLRYLEGQLSEADRRMVETILKSDNESAELYAVIKGLSVEGKSADWGQVRKAAGELASRLFDDYQKRRASPKSNHGVTVFDSKILPLPAGVRPATVDSRRIRYKIGSMDLEVSLYPVSTDSYEIIGQISGTQEKAPLDVMLKSGSHIFKVEADRFHLFRFGRVPVSKYTLHIISGKRDIGTATLEL